MSIDDKALDKAAEAFEARLKRRGIVTLYDQIKAAIEAYEAAKALLSKIEGGKP